MERYLREVIGNLLTHNSLSSPPPPFYFWVYDIFVDKIYVWRFYTNDQIWVFIFGHFSKISLITFDKFTPPPEYMFPKML